jgi:hypothetical protein
LGANAFGTSAAHVIVVVVLRSQKPTNAIHFEASTVQHDMTVAFLRRKFANSADLGTSLFQIAMTVVLRYRNAFDAEASRMPLVWGS